MKKMDWIKLVPTRKDYKTIQLQDIEPNPYRDMTRYPISAIKLDSLKASFRSDAPWKASHWMVREHPTEKGKYQLHFGHHRIQALRDLGCKKWMFAVDNVDERTMLRRFANENGESFANDADVAFETIYAVKKFLEVEFHKCSDYNDFYAQECLRVDFPTIKTERQFRQLKGNCKKGKDGVGIRLIFAFLGGEGISQWSSPTIQDVLVLIRQPEKDAEVNTKALKSLPKLSERKQFQQSVKRHKIPKAKQVDLAKKVKGTGRRKVKETVQKNAPKTKTKMQQLEEDFDGIVLDTRNLETKILGFKAECNALQIHTLQGKSVGAGWLAFISLGKEIGDFIKQMGGKKQKCLPKNK